jgi:dTDP-4-amino-4,6-dideoxygalactose transaminase
VQECFASLGYRQGQLPASEEAAASVLALPVYPELTPEMLNFVADTALQFSTGLQSAVVVPS